MSAPIVRKFGGTSVGSPEAMRRVASILGTEPCFAVLSAMSGVTQQLLDMVIAASLGKREQIDEIWQGLFARHHRAASELLGEDDIDLPIGKEINAILEEARMFC